MEAFLNWAEAFAKEKPYASLDRRRFVIFAWGLLLRELLLSNPMAAEPTVGSKGGADDSSVPIAREWPQGFIGNEPNWWMPDPVLNRAAMKKAVAARVVPPADTAHRLA